jgi:hypothetical protein
MCKRGTDLKTSQKVRRYARSLLIAANLLAGVALMLQPAATLAASYRYNGVVTCNAWEGNVYFVWVVDTTHSNQSGWAAFGGANQLPSVSWSKSIAYSNDKYQVHFGCQNPGGSQAVHNIGWTFQGTGTSVITMQGSGYGHYQR